MTPDALQAEVEAFVALAAEESPFPLSRNLLYTAVLEHLMEEQVRALVDGAIERLAARGAVRADEHLVHLRRAA